MYFNFVLFPSNYFSDFCLDNQVIGIRPTNFSHSFKHMAPLFFYCFLILPTMKEYYKKYFKWLNLNNVIINFILNFK